MAVTKGNITYYVMLINICYVMLPYTLKVCYITYDMLCYVMMLCYLCMGFNLIHIIPKNYKYEICMWA